MKVELISLSTPHVPGIQSVEDLIVYCARVSNPGNQGNVESGPRLIRYLIRHRHWSPFEMASMCLGITTTRDVARQILRHRSFSFQEFSGRYAAMPDVPELREARMQDTANRQHSLPCEDGAIARGWIQAQHRVHALATEAYRAALGAGIAREVARAVLPEGLTRSTLYMSGTMRSWIHYCDVRCGEDTQLEHRQVALACREFLHSVMPSLREDEA